jgi:uncharacterized protein (TIGR02453 family)
MTFSGWPDEALEFYEGLEADNSKTYWTAHKATYDKLVLAPMRELAEELAGELGEPLSSPGGRPPEPVKIFRPYRDVRFSSDKTPYKTHIGARIGPTGYVQLSADGLAAGNGMYQLEPPQLARYREAVAADATGAQLARIVADLATAGISVRGSGTLKSAPRGYPADHPRIELLRHKGLYAWQHWGAEPWLQTPQALDHVRSFFRTSGAFATWLTTTCPIDTVT